MSDMDVGRVHQAAPDRPGDLHPLQHLRGDLPGRRDHARRPQLRRRRRRVQPVHGLHLAVPDRLDRQLAHRAAGDGLPDRGAARLGRAAGRADAPSSWQTRASTRGDAAASPTPAAPPSRPSSSRGEAPFSSAAYRRDGAAVVGRACLHQPLRPEEPDHARPWSATSASPRPAREYDTHHIVLDFGAMPFPVLEGQSIGIVPPGVDARGRPHHRAPVLDRQPAQRRAAGLQQRVADGQARARGPPGPAGARRGQQLHVRPARSATRCR